MSLFIYIKYKIVVELKEWIKKQKKLTSIWFIYLAVFSFFIIYKWYTENDIYLLFAVITFILMAILSIYIDYKRGKWMHWLREKRRLKYAME